MGTSFPPREQDALEAIVELDGSRPTLAIPEGDALRVDTWLMSCRVLARRLDETMFSALAGFARRHGYKYIVGEYIPTAKNGQVATLYERLGFDPLPADGETLRFRFETLKDFPQPAMIECVDRTDLRAVEQSV